MTILNTGSNKKFSSGWENIFSGKATKKKEPVAAKKPAAKKKPAVATKKKTAKNKK